MAKFENAKGKLKDAFFTVAAAGAKTIYDVAAVAARIDGFQGTADAATIKGHVLADKLNAHKRG